MAPKRKPRNNPKAKESEKVDRISELPDNVLDKILTSLPIVEAAKTSILSRYWKRGWRNISILEFDSSFGTQDSFSEEDSAEKDVMLAICRTLFLHLGAIDGFTLTIPWLESCDEINPLIQFLSEKRVKHLKIHFVDGDFHILGSYLFSCSQLSTLDLAGCELKPPHNFGGFSHLITFVLNEVHITNDFFGMLITSCPLLQKLHLTECTFSSEVTTINIIASNLETFYYGACKPYICFISAPLLRQLDLHDYDLECEGTRRVDFDRLPKIGLDEFCLAVPALRKLNIHYTFLKTLDVRYPTSEASQPPNCLQQLKELIVDKICCDDLEDVHSLLALIRISPNLELFSAEMDMRHTEPISPFKILEPDEYDLPCNRLRTVELRYFFGTDPEMEFVKILLAISPQLKTMTIHQDGISDSKGVQILRKMLRFQRASAFVDINVQDV